MLPFLAWQAWACAACFTTGPERDSAAGPNPQATVPLARDTLENLRDLAQCASVVFGVEAPEPLIDENGIQPDRPTRYCHDIRETQSQRQRRNEGFAARQRYNLTASTGLDVVGPHIESRIRGFQNLVEHGADGKSLKTGPQLDLPIEGFVRMKVVSVDLRAQSAYRTDSNKIALRKSLKASTSSELGKFAIEWFRWKISPEKQGRAAASHNRASEDQRLRRGRCASAALSTATSL